MKKSPPPTPKKKQPHYKGHSTRHLFPSIQLPHKVQQRWVIFFFLFYIPFYLFFTSFFCFFNIFCIICVHPIRQLKKTGDCSLWTAGRCRSCGRIGRSQVSAPAASLAPEASLHRSRARRRRSVTLGTEDANGKDEAKTFLDNREVEKWEIGRDGHLAFFS